MKLKKCCLWAFVIIFAGTLPACNHESTEQGQEVESCPADQDPPVAERLDTLNIFIETSGSMAGFMPSRGGDRTDFQLQIDDLLANAESLEGNTIKSIRYYSAREKMYKEAYSRFSQMLRRGLRNVSSSSPIPQMLQNISEEYTGDEQVSIFISDFIYSPPNRRDRDFIANDIRRAISKVRQNKLVVSVYAAQSDFEGTYYPADTKSSPIRNCCDTKIPYYIWIMGPEEKVRLVNREVMKANFLEQVHFGFSLNDPSYVIIPGSGREGEWYPADREGRVVKLDNSRDIRDGGLTYTIGLNLEHLPGHVSNTEYLKNNLSLQVENGEAQIQKIHDRTQFLNQETINNKDRRLINCFTHFVKISVTKVFERNSNIQLKLVLDNDLPAWIDSYTTESDSQIEEEGPKTFSLHAIMDGARSATGNQAGKVFNITTTVDLSR